MENLINDLTQNIFLEALVLVIVLDTFLGCLRAIKEHKWNSGFGINGLLRKFAMIGSVAFLMLIDYIINIDFTYIKNSVMIKHVRDILFMKRMTEDAERKDNTYG